MGILGIFWESIEPGRQYKRESSSPTVWKIMENEIVQNNFKGTGVGFSGINDIFTLLLFVAKDYTKNLRIGEERGW